MIDLRLGQQRPVRMRRIGERHMIVMPTQQAQLLSLDTVEQQLQQARQQRQLQQAQVARLDVFIADLEQQAAAFRALPIERDAEDPDVPQPAPPAFAPALAEAIARGRAGMRQLQGLDGPDGPDGDPGVRGLTASGALVQGLVRNVPPPMPPPVLTDS